MKEMKPGARTNKMPGQSLIEFALVFHILLLLVLGAMDIGRMITTKIVMTNAAREGANYLSRRAFLDEDITLNVRMAETKDLIWEYCDNQKIDIDKSNDIIITNCCTVASPVSITVGKNVNLFFGNILKFLGVSTNGTVLVSTDVQMRVK